MKLESDRYAVKTREFGRGIWVAGLFLSFFLHVFGVIFFIDETLLLKLFYLGTGVVAIVALFLFFEFVFLKERPISDEERTGTSSYLS